MHLRVKVSSIYKFTEHRQLQGTRTILAFDGSEQQFFPAVKEGTFRNHQTLLTNPSDFQLETEIMTLLHRFHKI